MYKRQEKDGALARRFQSVLVEEPTEEQTMAILRGLCPRYEQHHGMIITEDALEAAIRLSVRYFPARFLPDKALDLLDEAAARLRIHRADMLGSGMRASRRLMLTQREVQQAAGAMTGLAGGQGLSAERLENGLRQSVVGQQEAVETVIHAILRSNAGLRDPRRPIGSFLFLGPSGVGTTQLCYALGKTLFGSEENIIKLDMIFLRNKIGGRGGIIISSIVRMANWLGTPVIAEGVETVEQAEFLKSIGCIYIQGYLFSKPVPEREYLRLLTETKTDTAVPGMQLSDKLDAEKFWNPTTQETLLFYNFVGGAAIIAFSDPEIETLRVNEKYLTELGMNMNQQDVILYQKNLNFDNEQERRVYMETMRRAIAFGEDETCETWRTVYSPCCGDDHICLSSTLHLIGKSKGQYLFYVLIRNITKEKTAYLELAESEKKFRTAGEQANIYCWEYTINTKEMRPCARCMRDLGLPKLLENYPEPVIASGLFPPDYAEMYREWHRKLAQGAMHLEAVIPLTADRIPFHVRYTAELDENGRPYKAYGSATQVVDGEA